MQVQEIMSKEPDCCLPGDSAQKAAKLMQQLDVGVVPVLKSGLEQKVIGIVTDRDLCLKVIVEGLDPASVRVEECMTGKVVSCRPRDDVQQAAKLMAEYQVRRLPVVDDNDTIVGVVSLGDIAYNEALEPARTGERLKEISEPSEEASKPRAEKESKG